MEDRYLFKAKRVDNGEWVQGYLYGIWEKRYILWGMTNDVPNMIEVDPSTICQCTGLKDKNGKLILENDVVKKGFYIDYNSVYQEEYVPSVISEEYVGTIKFEHFAWAVGIFNDHLKCILPICELSEHSEDIKYFEIVGNIFDNPKLLESEGN
jgi:uncharacterized phage protein (TIGR01671 family)